jgi:hypothetical protein
MGKMYGEPPAFDRPKALKDLRELLTYPHLGAWGMQALNDTLDQLIPDLRTDPPKDTAQRPTYPFPRD